LLKRLTIIKLKWKTFLLIVKYHLFIDRPIIKCKLFFAWYDFWVGLFWSVKDNSLYICPLPCIVVKIHLLTTIEKRIIKEREETMMMEGPYKTYRSTIVQFNVLNRNGDIYKPGSIK